MYICACIGFINICLSVYEYIFWWEERKRRLNDTPSEKVEDAFFTFQTRVLPSANQLTKMIITQNQTE